MASQDIASAQITFGTYQTSSGILIDVVDIDPSVLHHPTQPTMAEERNVAYSKIKLHEKDTPSAPLTPLNSWL